MTFPVPPSVKTEVRLCHCYESTSRTATRLLPSFALNNNKGGVSLWAKRSNLISPTRLPRYYILVTTEIERDLSSSADSPSGITGIGLVDPGYPDNYTLYVRFGKLEVTPGSS